MKRLFLGILAICWVIGVKAQEVFSPDGKINVRFFLSEKVSTGNQRMYPEGTPYYEVLYDKHSFLLPSRMGFDLLGTAEMKHYLKSLILNMPNIILFGNPAMVRSKNIPISIGR